MQDYTQYNHRVKSATVERLLDINRRFYSERAQDFSDTRGRVQPGVQRTVESLTGGESILDLGCGNGSFARELARNSHRGPYAGLDASLTLLEDARRSTYPFPAEFVHTDLASQGLKTILPGLLPGLTERGGSDPESGAWDVVTAFAFLHHVPGSQTRLRLLKEARQVLKTQGSLILSNWQFTTNPRYRDRIQSWSIIQIEEAELEPGDFLLDWRRGGRALRYVHEFDEAELAGLASDSGFLVTDQFYSDGADRRSSLYQRWNPA